MEIPPQTFTLPCTVFFWLFSYISIGLAYYPTCSPLTDNWTWVSQIYANRTTVQHCKDDCRTLGITYCALRIPPDTDVEGCDYRCGDECGGDSGKHSIYPVCQEARSGYDCEFDCPANGHCADGVCHVEYGSCPAGCVAGYHGANCDQVCGECINGSCGQHGGVCDGGCRAGWYTPTCSGKCSVNCYLDACDIHDASCVNGCESGWYNANCSRECSEYCACDPIECHRYSGECNDGCRSGWYTPRCTEPCPEHCNLTSCTLEQGQCEYGCKMGYHGLSCENLCPANCSEVGCIQDSGLCYGCLHGTHGELCDETCPANCADKMCDTANGTCAHGCQPGWTGIMCDTATTPDGLNTSAWIGMCVSLGVVIIALSISFLLFACKAKRSSRGDTEGMDNLGVGPSLGHSRVDAGCQTNTTGPSHDVLAGCDTNYEQLIYHGIARPDAYDTLEQIA